MNAAPHATHPATGRYYATREHPKQPYTIVAPDGTVHSVLRSRDFTIAIAVEATLNAIDREARKDDGTR